MLTKEKLRSYYVLITELKSIEKRLDELEGEVYGVKRVSAGLEKGTACEDFKRALAKMLDMKALYTVKWDSLINARRNIEKAVDELPPMQRKIVRAKYIEGQTWEEVADTVGYSLRQVYRIMKASGF